MVRRWLAGTVAALCLGAFSTDVALAGKDQDQGGPIDPFYGTGGGPIDPFYGSINPFYGGINPFYGGISPFWGDISPFWGSINPFYGTIQPFYGSIDPFWGTINPFNSGQLSQVYAYWNTAGPAWGSINTLWGQLQASNATDYSQLQAALSDFVTQAVSMWGAPAQTFVNAMFAKYGIDPTNPMSLANTSAETRSAFFLNFYDGAMDLTKLDHVDWWMAAVKWSPQIVQTDNTPGPLFAGVLDASITQNYSDVKNLKFIGGYQGYVNDHGAAVASLMAAQQDKVGVMGEAPAAQVLLYNPFDTTGTASWTDVTNGIFALYQQNATLVNASLGVPGWVLSKEWGSILTSSQLSDKKHSFILIKAAGNESTVQTTDISWPAGYSAPNNLLLVGSVGPTRQISQFSNTPGEACILVNNACQEQNKLKYRFLVAPGELMLVENNQGGTTRMTGTSFSAPLVSGTIALLQTRWPWLQQYADETVQIILQSATDLGRRGVDPVYGRGMLNVEAAQSPLNFDNITVFTPFTYDGKPINVDKTKPNWTPAQLKAAILTNGQLAAWENQKAYLVAYENIGFTYRDFIIPLSSQLVGKNQNVNGLNHQFQSYIYHRLLDWSQPPKPRHHKLH
jgi:subtilisin family serine protease